MKTLFLALTFFSASALANIESCEEKYMEAYGHSHEIAKDICTLNDFGRKLVRKGTNPSQAKELSVGEETIIVDSCEEDAELQGHKEELAIEICKLTECEKILVLEGSSSESLPLECREKESVEVKVENTI